MNQMKATVVKMDNFERISYVEFTTGKNSFSLVALELDENLKVGSTVTLFAKATNVALSKTKLTTITVSNQLECLIKEINEGVLLSSVTLQMEENILESIITTSSLHRLNLTAGDTVFALIKATDLSVLEIL